MQTLTTSWFRGLCVLGALCATWGSFAQPVQPVKDSSAQAEVFVQTGNSLMVTTVRFSADGKRIASCDAAGFVVGWDSDSGRQYRDVHRHVGMCLGLAFTPDGEAVISSGGPNSGNEVVMSRWVDGQVLQKWEGHTGEVADLVATRDGTGAWTLGGKDGLQRWALGSDKPVQIFPLLLPGEVANSAPFNKVMALTSDQSRVFVARSDGSVLVLDLKPGAMPRLLVKLPEVISYIALSPDGTMLALANGNIMGSTNKNVLLLDASSGQELQRLSGHEGNVSALAFSNDGTLLASAAQIDTQTLLNGRFRDIKNHEALRLWRVQDGSLLADVRNARNVNGTPFVRGSLIFSAPLPVGQGEPSSQRLALAMWDEAARIYSLDAAHQPKLLHTLEGRGLSPRQFKVSDANNRMLVSDARPRIAPKDTYLTAADVRREFGKDADWTPERQKRIEQLYAPRGLLSKAQRASLWNLKTGRMERVIDWQRGATTDMGLDAQGRFTSLAPLFPSTTLLTPVKARMVREATADSQGEVTLRHFSYEPWDGKADDVFTPMSPPTPAPAPESLPTPEQPAHAGAYNTEVVVQSPSQRWTAIAGIPIESKKDAATSKMSPRVFVQQRMPDGEQQHRYDIATKGRVQAMAISSDDRTLWIVGTQSGFQNSEDHQSYLMAVNLADGSTTQSWKLPLNVTSDRVAAHPQGNMAITNGTVALSVYDLREPQRKFRINPSMGDRNIKALAISDNGRSIISGDVSGVVTLWDWPQDAAPTEKWARKMIGSRPHLLSFMAQDQRMVTGSDDGSLRILASKDGAEIARMIRFDNDEWITITPEGYFVASQEGDRWLNVRRAGKVFGIDQFYDVFYRPDIVERRLAGQPIGSIIEVTLQDAINQPPPQVSLSLPELEQAKVGQKIKLSMLAQSLGGGVGELRVMHNGKLLDVLNREPKTATQPATVGVSALAATAATPAQVERTLTRALRMAVKGPQGAVEGAPQKQQAGGDLMAELVAGENVFSVIGFNSQGNLNARPVTRIVQATGTAPAPKVFVLAVGVDHFLSANSAPTLQFAVKDSTDFANAVRAKIGTAYSKAPVNVTTLHNQNATRAGLMRALNRLQKEVGPNDILVWFVASHGTLDNQAQYGIVLHDWDGRANEDSLFSSRDILDSLRRIKAFSQIVILDTCHAGGVNSLVKSLYDARLAVLARNMGLHIFASASATEEALDGYSGNGLFTHTLIDGLKNKVADKNSDGVVSVNELGEFARRETMRIAKAVRHSQEPLLMNFGKDVKVYELK